MERYDSKSCQRLKKKIAYDNLLSTGVMAAQEILNLLVEVRLLSG